MAVGTAGKPDEQFMCMTFLSYISVVHKINSIRLWQLDGQAMNLLSVG